MLLFKQMLLLGKIQTAGTRLLKPFPCTPFPSAHVKSVRMGVIRLSAGCGICI